MMSKLCWLLLLGLVTLAAVSVQTVMFVPVVNAQVLYGSVTGTVTDQSGAGVPKAHVAATNRVTGVEREADADDNGHYTIIDLAPGDYDLKVTASGFKPLTQTNLMVAANTITNGDAKLQVGAMSEQVTVEASVVNLQTEKSDVHTELSEKAILNMPLNQYRNFQTLINLVPGATPGVFQNAIADTPERALSTNINGTNRNNNNTRVDGAADVFVWLPHHAVYIPPAETVQEVNISTNNFDPEQGMTGGAAITVITKSGTNQFHGVGFEYFQNQALRAKQFFETGPKGDSKLNDFGGTFGGPIKKDKLFFFGSYNGLYERDNRNTGLVTLPTTAIRAGDFSSILTKIYDPTTGNPDGTGRSQFVASSNSGSPNFNSACTNPAGCPNMIPSARIDAISQKILALIPTLAPGAPNTQNYLKSATQKLNRNNFDAKVDWNRTSRHSVFAKYSAMKSVFHGEPSLGQAIGDCACDGGLGDFHDLVQLVTVGHTLTLSPTLVVDGNVGFTRMSEYGQTPDFGKNIGSDVLGIPGTNNGSDLRSSGIPFFSVTGFADLGNPEGWNPAFRNDWSFTSSHNVRWSHGKHQVSAGTDIVHHHLNHWQPELGSGPRGEFDFSGSTTALNCPATRPGCPATGAPAPDLFNAFAQFELGLFNGTGKSEQFIKATAKEWQFGWFVGDRYRITSKLTVTLGLRYEYYPLMTRDGAFKFDRYDFTTNKVLLGGIGGNPANLGVTTSKKLFAPRVGFAYQINNGTVVRAGFGISVDPLPLARPLRGFYPLTVGSNFSGVNGFASVGSFSPNPPAGGSVLPSCAPGTFNPGVCFPVGIPSVCCPDISSGTLPLPPQALERTVGPGELKRGYIESWNLVVERKLPANFFFSVGYVGTQTVHQFGDLNINASLPGTGQLGQPLNCKTANFTTNPPTCVVPAFGRTTDTLLFQGWLSANYHSLQAAITRQFSKGLMVKGAYTYSKAINWTDDDGWAGLNWNDPNILRRNRAQAGFNTPQIFQLAYVYELPLGKDKPWVNGGGAATKILSGWQTSGIFSARSGQPFGLTASGASLNAVGQTQTPDQVGPAKKLGGVGRGNPYYDPAAFAPVTRVGYGNVGRNPLLGPGAVNLDFSLFRTVNITERFGVQFRVDAANLFNSPHFNNPNGDLTSGSFMEINSAKFDERQFRLGVRLAF
jgi:Carboxypeptidase regulatory-like domain/TonB dependent receptor